MYFVAIITTRTDKGYYALKTQGLVEDKAEAYIFEDLEEAKTRADNLAAQFKREIIVFQKTPYRTEIAYDATRYRPY